LLTVIAISDDMAVNDKPESERRNAVAAYFEAYLERLV
jgi:hypothetical protein